MNGGERRKRTQGESTPRFWEKGSRNSACNSKCAWVLQPQKATTAPGKSPLHKRNIKAYEKKWRRKGKKGSIILFATRRAKTKWSIIPSNKNVIKKQRVLRKLEAESRDMNKPIKKPKNIGGRRFKRRHAPNCVWGEGG